MSFDYDLFVIGAGSGGVRASRIAAQLGARVAVAEDRYLGGTCVNVGCVPKKLYVYASEFSKAFEDAAGFGWQMGNAQFDWATLRDNKTAEIQRLNGIYDAILGNAGVETISGFARIVDPHTVDVGGKHYRTKTILIAVGGWPRQPEFPGNEHVIDSNRVFDLDVFPKRVLVQGGGYIAVEFAGIFKGLGSETELVYRGPLFLRSFDEEIRRFVASEIATSGVRLTFNNDIASVEKHRDGFHVTLCNGEKREVDCILSAIGRLPKIQGIGLENTRVTLSARGTIEVNDNFQTHEPSIYALGDVVGRMELTPVALAEGMALAHHLFGGKKIDLDYDNIATAIFCQPNIGTIGLSEERAIATGKVHHIFTSEFRPLKNTISGSLQRTLMKLVVERDSGKIVGAHMAGPEAGEIMQGIAIAIKAGATKADFDQTIGIHPTSAEEFVTMRQVSREVGGGS